MPVIRQVLTLDSLVFLFFFTLPRCRRLLGRRVVKIPHVDTPTPVLEYPKLRLHSNLVLDFLLSRPIGPSATICQCKAFGTSTAGQHGAKISSFSSTLGSIPLHGSQVCFFSSSCVAAVDSSGGGIVKVPHVDTPTPVLVSLSQYLPSVTYRHSTFALRTRCLILCRNFFTFAR